MPEYEFRATGRNGQTITGKRAAPSREALEVILRREQLNPSRIVEKGREIAIPKPKVSGKVSAKELAFLRGNFPL